LDDWLFVGISARDLNELYIAAAKKVLGENNAFLVEEEHSDEQILLLAISGKAGVQLLLPERYKDEEVFSASVSAGSPMRYMTIGHDGGKVYTSLGTLNPHNRSFRGLTYSRRFTPSIGLHDFGSTAVSPDDLSSNLEKQYLYKLASEQVLDYMRHKLHAENPTDIFRHTLVRRKVKLQYVSAVPSVTGNVPDGIFEVVEHRETLFEFQLRESEIAPETSYGTRFANFVGFLVRSLLSLPMREKPRAFLESYNSFDAKKVPVGPPYSSREMEQILWQYPAEYRDSAFYRFMLHHYPEGRTFNELTGREPRG